MYKFDLSKITIKDFLAIQNNKTDEFLKIASKCSLTDVNTIPITEYTAFLNDFSAGLADYLSTQFKEGLK